MCPGMCIDLCTHHNVIRDVAYIQKSTTKKIHIKWNVSLCIEQRQKQKPNQMQLDSQVKRNDFALRSQFNDVPSLQVSLYLSFSLSLSFV